MKIWDLVYLYCPEPKRYKHIQLFVLHFPPHEDAAKTVTKAHRIVNFFCYLNYFIYPKFWGTGWTE